MIKTFPSTHKNNVSHTVRMQAQIQQEGDNDQEHRDSTQSRVWLSPQKAHVPSDLKEQETLHKNELK